MGRKEDWEELEKWQREQDSIRTEKNIKEFIPKDYKKTEIFTKIVSKIASSIFSIFIIIFIIGFLISLIFINNLLGNYASVDVKKRLQESYRGQKFVVVEDYGKEIEKDNGLYLMSPKNNKNIVFKVLKDNISFEDDYSENRLKYYIENCSDKNLINCLNIEQGTKKRQDTEFLNYEAFIDIENYNEIEEKCKHAYKVVEYLEEQDKTMYEAITLRNKDIGYYYSVRCNELLSIEKEMYKAKYTYIDTLKDKNNKEELNKISKEEIEDNWKPKELEIILNGENVKLYNGENAKYIYYLNDQEYKIAGIGNILLKNIDSVEILKISNSTDFVKRIKYKNKIYKVKQDDTSKQNKDDTVYISGTLEEFIEKFDADIKYDLENRKVYINVF